MLVLLSDWLNNYVSAFRVVDYLTFRAIFSLITALAISLMVGPYVIKKLQLLHFGQVIRNDGPESHFSKRGTPTMGGIMIVGVIFFTSILWCKLDNVYIWVVLFALVSHALIGFADDYLKVVRKNTAGLIPRWKYFWQSVCAIAIGVKLYCVSKSPNETTLVVPFFKDFMPNMGIFFIVLVYFVIVGSSNAVNLTDGLDGLAIMCTLLVAAGLGIVAWATSNMEFKSHCCSNAHTSGNKNMPTRAGCATFSGMATMNSWGMPSSLFMSGKGMPTAIPVILSKTPYANSFPTRTESKQGSSVLKMPVNPFLQERTPQATISIPFICRPSNSDISRIWSSGAIGWPLV